MGCVGSVKLFVGVIVGVKLLVEPDCVLLGVSVGFCCEGEDVVPVPAVPEVVPAVWELLVPLRSS